MARVLNFTAYFFGSICWVTTGGLVTRYYTQLQNWYWMFFILFLMALIALGSYYGRKGYTGLLNTSESVLLGLLIVLFVGAILGGIASYV